MIDYVTMSLQVCADSMSQLRKIDLYRFLETAKKNDVLASAEAWVTRARPDLLVELKICLAELIRVQKPCEHCSESITSKMPNETCPHCGFEIPF